jgi:hypothetical protein
MAGAEVIKLKLMEKSCRFVIAKVIRLPLTRSPEPAGNIFRKNPHKNRKNRSVTQIEKVIS